MRSTSNFQFQRSRRKTKFGLSYIKANNVKSNLRFFLVYRRVQNNKTESGCKGFENSLRNKSTGM